MANYDFKKDLVIGHRGEKIILEDLKQMGAVPISINDTKTHDLVVKWNDKVYKVECKTDVYKNTCNLFLETKCRGKDSGINATTADLFATYFYNDSEIWYIKTEALKRLMQNHDHKKIYMGGDKNSNTEGVLIRKNMYKSQFIVRKINPLYLNSF